MTQDIGISVVIPTHNRAATLPRLLAALAGQTYPAERMEVVVVADGCTDQTLEVLARQAAPFALHVVAQPQSGAAAARNRGAGYAAGARLLFLDDDIEPEPGLVAAHAVPDPGEERVIIGYLPPRLPARPDFLQAALAAWWHEQYAAMAEPGHRFCYTDLLSGNFSLPAPLFRRLGGFTAGLPIREDYELGLRLIEAGARFSFCPEALGHHYDRADLDRSLVRKRQEGRADVYLGRRYPALRPALLISQLWRHGSPPVQVLRRLAFVSPSAGDVLAAALRPLLQVSEWMRLHGAWKRLQIALYVYWYWRGTAEALGPQADLAAFLRVADAGTPWGPESDLDLEAGLETAECQLDRDRPAAVRVRYAGRLVGRMPPLPGAERLRGAHLRLVLGAAIAGAAPRAAGAARRWAPTGRAAWSAPEDPAFRHGYKVAGNGYEVAGNGYEVAGNDRVVANRGSAVAGRDRSAVPGARPCTGHATNGEAAGHDVAVSVIVCTRDRTASLEDCLRALLALDWPEYEVIVVDNAPAGDATARLAAGLPVRYVCEPQPGLDWARNRGVAEAQHSIIAFTDDDARPDRGWLRGLAGSFADPDVMAVTGPCLPAALDSPAQLLFEQGYGGMNHGFERRSIRRDTLTTAGLLWASAFGVGANMAFRRELFAAIGPFDVTLDVGTPTGGGGDLEFFHRLVAAGHTLLYEPDAVVWHMHRESMEALERQLYCNGLGFGAYLLACARQGTVPRRSIVGFALWHWLAGWFLRRLVRPHGFPRRLVAAELAGALRSPWAYRASRHAIRRRIAPEQRILPQPVGPG